MFRKHWTSLDVSPLYYSLVFHSNFFKGIMYNANVEELIDASGTYFSTMGQKAQEGAISSAKVAVA